MECGSRFINSYEAIAYAWELVNEYVKHEREQDKLNPFASAKPKKIWTRGGMIKNDI